VTAPHSNTRRRPVIRVFVSSTFSDMKHERNALQEEVFPRLEQLCLQSGFQFQAIDLRWGVSTEAGLDHRTMRICFDELRRAQEISPRPNFLILLGNRYGWRPLPEEISVAEFHALECAAAQVPAASSAPAVAVLRDWYRRDENAVPPVHVLQSRRQDLHDGRDYTKDAVWNEVQAVLWAIINHAMPPDQLQGRFDDAAPEGDAPPPIVRFQASATEQEIWRGALRVPDAQEHVLAFLREIENIGGFTDPTAIKDFVDVKPSGGVDADLQAEQERLKDELRKRLGKLNVFEAKAALVVGPQNQPAADVTTNHLEQLCADVERRLTEIIRQQIDEYWAQTTQASAERALRELKIEQDEHERFGRERGAEASFVGRQAELKAILDYVQNDSPWPLVVHGASGCGKTSLLARAAQELAKTRQPIVRFIGVQPRSSDLRSLLGSLCQELRLRHPREGELPADPKALREELHEHLRAATPEQPLILFLDALDQLSEADSGRLLHWIPAGRLPAHVKLVVSCLSDRAEGDPAGQPYAELTRRGLPAESFINLDALSEAEARVLLFDRWLPQAGRTVNPDQRARIEQRLASAACRQPIYLRLLFEEARLWRSHDAAPDLGEGVPALLGQLIERLRLPTNHGELLVDRVLGYLTASREGLAENEILEVLFRDHEYKAELDDATRSTRHEMPPNATRIPIALWSRLRFDLVPYLAERAATGANVLTFYHRQVAEWVLEHFGEAFDRAWQPHQRLAAYFQGLADPEKDRSWKGESQRPFLQVCYHLVGGRQWDELCQVLCDLLFIQGKCSVGLVHDLMRDYNEAFNALPEFREELERNRRHDEAMRRYNLALRDYAARRAEWRDRRDHGEAVPEPEYPPHPPELGTRSEVGIPEDQSERAARLRHFVNFVSGHLALLTDHPTHTLEVAYNYAETGPVSAAAEGLLDTLTRPWLRRSPRPPAPPLRPQCLRTLEGHSDGVFSVSVSLDGRCAVSAGWDNTLRLWDLESGECLRTHKGHRGRVRCVSFSPDGRRAVSASEDKTLRLWDLESGECLHTLEGHREVVWSVNVSPDGRRAVSASSDRTLRRANDVPASYDKPLRLWDLASGECLAVYHAGTSRALSVATSPSGDRILCGTDDGRVHFLSPVNVPPSGPAILTATNPTSARCPYCATEFAPPSEVVAAIQAQSAVSGQQAGILSACPRCARAIQFNPFFAAAGDYADVLRRGLESLRCQEKAESRDALGHLKALAAQLAATGHHDEAARYAQEAAALAPRIAH